MFIIYIIGNEIEIGLDKIDEKLNTKADVILTTSYVQEDDLKVIKNRN